jgi:hypothetical protein
MESRQPTAEEHPTRYRAILDLVAELERIGLRREAQRLRSEAIATYSRGWDQASLNRLGELYERGQKDLARRRRTFALDGG